jgi:hypothetical protein
LPTAEKWLFCQFLEVLSKMVLNSSFDWDFKLPI